MAKAGIKVDASGFYKAIKDGRLNQDDVLQIEGAGAYVLVNGMRLRVPKDTHATENSIKPHIVENSATRLVDEVGPETIYSPAIEYGRPDMPGYPAQPFIRPTVDEDGDKANRAMGTAFKAVMKRKWPK